MGIENKRTNQSIVLLIIGIILLASSLRAPLTSVGPVISSIRESFTISNTVAGALTTLPLLAFAFISPFIPRVSKKISIERTIFIALLIVTIGIFLRSAGTVQFLFIGTILIGIGIAAGNVLLPGLIKQNFAHKVGLLTGIYAVSMNLSAAVASGLSAPLATTDAFSWKSSLAIWGFLTLLAALFWLPQIKSARSQNEKVQSVKKQSSLLHSALAWKITIFMGLQSLIYYSLIAWIPNILQEQGVTMVAAGWFTSIMQFAIFPCTFIVPILAGRSENQRILVGITALSFVIGIGGLLFSLPVIALWMILLGIGSGFAFSLSMMFFTLRTSSAQEASEMSGMAQSIGYSLAALGPLLFGFVRDLTSSWTVPLLLLGVAAMIIFVVGMGAGKKGFVSSVD